MSWNIKEMNVVFFWRNSGERTERKEERMDG
jgi:hypothetical protein